MASSALFIAKEINGITEYTSRKTGEKYSIVPEDGGLCVRSTAIQTTIWTNKLSEAFRLIETLEALHQN